MKRKHLSGILAVASCCALAIAVLLVWRQNRPVGEAGGKSFTVEVIHKDSSSAEFTYQTDAEYLGAVLLEAGLIAGSNGPYGLYVETVDGETADYNVDGGWWRLTCNGEDSQTGADTTPIHDGDQFAWIYTVG